MITTTRTLVILATFVICLVIGIFSLVSIVEAVAVSSKKSQIINYDGKEISLNEYGKRLDYCWSMQASNIISADISKLDCRTWVLTYEGESLIAEYAIKKALSDNPRLSLSDIIN